MAEVERKLAQQRCRQEDDGVPELRASTITDVVWAPPRWLPQARRVLAGLAERNPARTIFLVPLPGRGTGVEADAVVYDFEIGDGREVLSEVIELRLRGEAARHPASVVLPLLISDLPAFCRWRGRPDWDGSALQEIVEVCDRLVVDSSEWRGLPAAYGELAGLFEGIVVSDIAWRRTLPWRVALADRWPQIRKVDRLAVEGPRADALLLTGWLRSRLRRDVALTHRSAATISRVRVDGDTVAPPRQRSLSDSGLLSAELDTLTRDPVYEAAVRSTGA
ncbi:MAG: glucose-6-phosphate dehydrogenase assembly protein OpcA [Gaiella sp.]|nr:glucose-6-phosphate dehydrogenase assembly protein OpcA [Gaiella sp.]